MTLTERIERLEELRREGVDWSEIDAAMYGELPEDRRPAWIKRMDEKGLPNQDRTAYLKDVA